MAAYLITYRLGRSETEQNYPDLYKYFRETGYAIVGTSARVITSQKTAKEIANDLQPYLDSDDMLYIFELTGDWMGFRGPETENADSETVVDWLNKRLVGRPR